MSKLCMTEFSPQIAEPSTFLVTGMLRRTKCASVRRALRRNPGRSPDARAILGGTGAAWHFWLGDRANDVGQVLPVQRLRSRPAPTTTWAIGKT